ncbi:MAG: methyltransferase domain-containing protein [bacterium]|nr:methyltransferase domain-containing protein [bacterium]
MHSVRTRWSKYLCDLFLDDIPAGSRVLDFGAGDGLDGKYIGEQRGASVTLLDVQDKNQTKLPMKLYDGTTIPFSPDSFDAVFAIAVLHHIPREAHRHILAQIRTIAPRLIVMEDTPANWFRWFLNVIGDTIVNVPKSISMQYSYRTVTDWRDFFEKLGFTVERTASVAPWYPIQRTLFVLKRK